RRAPCNGNEMACHPTRGSTLRQITLARKRPLRKCRSQLRRDFVQRSYGSKHRASDFDALETGGRELSPKRRHCFEFDVITRHPPEQRIAQLLQRYELAITVKRPLIDIGRKEHAARFQCPKDFVVPCQIVSRIEITENFYSVDEVLALMINRQVHDGPVNDELSGHLVEREFPHLGTRLDA